MAPKHVHRISIVPLTCYLAGVVCGDGNVSGSRKGRHGCRSYRINISTGDRVFAEALLVLIKSFVSTKVSVEPRVRPKAVWYQIAVSSKDLWVFLHEDLGIPAGKKAAILRIPKAMWLHDGLLRYFLAGLFDADGGRRGNTLGFTTASEGLQSDILQALSLLGYAVRKSDSWMNKRYDRRYFGVRLTTASARTFLTTMPILCESKRRLCLLHVGVPERSIGTRLGREAQIELL